VLREEGINSGDLHSQRNATDTTQRIGPIFLKRQLAETTCSMSSLSYDNVTCRHLVTTFEKMSLSDEFKSRH
jgi:hypothetical protein